MDLSFDLSPFPPGTTAHAFRPLSPDDIEIDLTTEREEMDPAEHFENPEDLALVRERMTCSDWAWFQATVTVMWGERYAADHLGACSYENETDFRRGDYFADMAHEALSQLNAELRREWVKARNAAIQAAWPDVLRNVLEWAQGSHERCDCARCEATGDAMQLLSWLKLEELPSRGARHG